MDHQCLLANRTKGMGANAIREILKVVSQPGMVSVAGGIPAPESFPLDIMNELTAVVLDKYGPAALQYDPTEGFWPFREALAGYLADFFSLETTSEEVLVASGSQGVLDGLGKILLDRGDPVAVEAPTYIGALQAFNPYQPSYVRLETDDFGLIPESLEKVLLSHRPKFVYLNPTFQNPTGRTLPLDRREEVARIAVRHQALIIEDDPYSLLRYRGTAVPPLKTLAPENVVYVSTLSKVFAPGLRLGFCLAPAVIHRWLVLAKQGVDLHTGTLSQALAAEYLTGGYLDRHLPKIKAIYRPRQEAMLKALEEYFPPGFHWSKPDGGMFLWVEGPPGSDMGPVYQRAIERKVAFVPGRFFYTRPDQGLETMRLNFSKADENTIETAVRILAEVLSEEFDYRPAASLAVNK